MLHPSRRPWTGTLLTARRAVATATAVALAAGLLLVRPGPAAAETTPGGSPIVFANSLRRAGIDGDTADADAWLALAKRLLGVSIGVTLDEDDISRITAAAQERSAWALALVGVEVGAVADDDELRRAAEKVGVAVGEDVAAADAEQVITVAHRQAAGVLSALEIHVGDSVEPGDIMLAKRALGVGIGSSLDAADAARVMAVARGRLSPPPPPPAARQTRPNPVALPVFATAGGVELRLISRETRLVGFHQAAYPGVTPMIPARRPGMTTLPTRGRATHHRSAADVSVPAGHTILSPVTGKVVSVEPYALYGRYPDVRIRIAAANGGTVTVLHVLDAKVLPGQLVEGGVTPVAATANQFPFASQIDRFAGRMPHVHVEVRG